jgi:N-acyl-D-amino-acid deacylase
LRLLKYVDLDQDTVRAAAFELIKDQRGDGGWGQKPDMDSDAYATGSVLVALSETGYCSQGDPVFQRGVAYLLKTQLDDGSWHVVSRSKPFQKYFETGFPHGTDQFISSAASSWAVWALLLSLPESTLE